MPSSNRSRNRNLPETRRRYRLLALDVDGTLLDRDGMLRPSTAAAIRLAAASGIRPVLCTGRRFRRARPVAELLGIDSPIVCNSGAIVKDPLENQTLWRADFDGPLLLEVLEIFREYREPVVSFSDHEGEGHDFLIEQHNTGRALFDDYVEQNRENAGVFPGWTRLVTSMETAHAHFHLCAIGKRPAMLDFESVLLDRLGGRITTFVQKSPHYAGTMCEILRHDASKWTAVLHLAKRWGIDAEEICAVGDDMNDVPMIAGAGLGVAMGHAPDAVKGVADMITEDHDHDGVAHLIHQVLLG